MILSDEPVYYKTGEYGIRIENLVLGAPHAMAGAEKEMLCFETLTLASIDLALVDTALLDEGEKAWPNAYPARVLGEIGPLVDEGTQEWREQEKTPISGEDAYGGNMRCCRLSRDYDARGYCMSIGTVR